MIAETIAQEEAPESITARRTERTAKKIVQAVADTPSPAPIALPMRITDGDLPYHARVCDAQRDARERMAAADAAMASWWGYLQATYDLADGDIALADGTIIRAATGE